MNDHSIPRLQARDPGDIAQVVPHLIGFQPHESLVVIVTLQRQGPGHGTGRSRRPAATGQRRGPPRPHLEQVPHRRRPPDRLHQRPRHRLGAATTL